ncbi:MAG: FecR family protein [Methylococcales bacterium]
MKEFHSDQFARDDLAITEQAFAWFVKLGCADIPDSERAEFERWIDRDERHRRAYEQAQQIWRDPRIVAALRKTRPERSAVRKPGVFALGRRAIFALLVVCLVGVLFDPVLRWQADYRTGTGERQSVSLADGSRLILAPDSAVALSLTQTRQVRLLKGEVYCEVQSDPNRPFVVKGRHSQTQVLGTRFSVDTGDAADTLTVVEGRVEFSSSGYGHSHRIVHADEQASTDGNRMSATTAIAARQVLAWTQGTLALEQTPLAEAIERIRPYHPGLLWLRDESLRDFPVSGRFDLNDSRRILDTLAETLPIRVSRIAPWLVIVSRK